MPRNIFAFTAPGAQPEFISVNKHIDSAIVVIVRSCKSNGAATAQISLTPAQARELGLNLIQATN